MGENTTGKTQEMTEKTGIKTMSNFTTFFDSRQQNGFL